MRRGLSLRLKRCVTGEIAGAAEAAPRRDQFHWPKICQAEKIAAVGFRRSTQTLIVLESLGLVAKRRVAGLSGGAMPNEAGERTVAGRWSLIDKCVAIFQAYGGVTGLDHTGVIWRTELLTLYPTSLK